MTEHLTKLRRLGVAVTLGLSLVTLGVVVSCGDPPAPGADGTRGQPSPPSCATPQAGCPCTPGTVVACGQKVSGDLNFLYCYEGRRVCGAGGTYGDCGEGSVVPRSLGNIHTSALGSSLACSGLITAPLLVCTSGKQQGEYCASNLDCGSGVKKCLGGPDDGAS
ncbi:MAG TPA: hypothetical protein VLT33_31075, partial [Labilithrix sp.]|nr:hypothetical protein [Labilithrix sp.]